mgnify:CR=1 FL=1
MPARTSPLAKRATLEWEYDDDIVMRALKDVLVPFAYNRAAAASHGHPPPLRTAAAAAAVVVVVSELV